jgi:protease IV
MKRWFGRFFISIGVLVVVLAVVGVVVALSSREKVPERTVLLIDFEQQALEAVPQDPLAGLVLSERIIVRELVDALDAAAADDRVKGVIARIGGGHPMAMTQEFRQAVQRFRASGKPAIAFAETLGEVGPGNTGITSPRPLTRSTCRNPATSAWWAWRRTACSCAACWTSSSSNRGSIIATNTRMR